jgi:hypothetical protein
MLLSTAEWDKIEPTSFFTSNLNDKDDLEDKRGLSVRNSSHELGSDSETGEGDPSQSRDPGCCFISIL